MKIVIVEDEVPAFNRLNKLIKEHIENSDVLAHLDSVAGTKEWFEQNDAPDVIFLDIHLADGSAFDLLDAMNIETPIIFTTAYDQYAIDAFKASSVGYLLKPVKATELKETVAKLEDFKKIFKEDKVQDNLLDALKPAEYKKRFMVRFGDNLKAVLTEDIAYFYSESKATFARMKEGRSYPIDNNLDALEKLLDPDRFFRINRQYLISLDAIDNMKTYSKSRVLVKLLPETKEAPLVSSERSASFKKWLSGDL